ncbi:MAG: type II toxin-antitoxin system prevent-host-death family antitoxin [Nitrospira sp.]|nr:type II toxin-antitoxin system prevent-host-death family antitoxin [Nitrospira sp.]
MGPINIKGTRRQLKVLLDRVEAGETITISRRGAVIAKLVPPDIQKKRLPSLKALRRTIRPKGRPLSTLIQEARMEDRA